jgi:subtilisin-like proprotein convertase family protein
VNTLASKPITNVTASFYLTHTFDSDLTISLVGPDSTTIRLSEANGGGGHNYGSACSPLTSRTTFDDSVAPLIASGFAPFVGSFRPEEPLAAFNGKSGAAVNGTWKLRITDSFFPDTGTLLCWSIYINPPAPVLPPTVVTSTATSISQTGATLNGTANPNGSATTGNFGPDSRPATRGTTPSQSLRWGVLRLD